MRPQTNPFPLLAFLSFVLLTACSQRADGDEEISKMIVGTWKTTLDKDILYGNDYHIMEFTADNRYREIRFKGPRNWSTADSTGIGGLEGVAITFEDSVYYEIENSVIHYSTTKSELPYPNFLPNDHGITWLKPTEIKLNKLKYEKI